MPRAVLVLLAVLAAVLLAPGAQAAVRPAPATVGGGDGLSLALRSGRITEAQYALERARALFDRNAVTRRFGRLDSSVPGEATLVLRDLALRLDDLGPADRLRAERLLLRPNVARPNDPGSDGRAFYDRSALPTLETSCGKVCVSWVEKGRDAPALADGDGNGRPDYIDTVVETMNVVWSTEITAMGYRPPKSDATSTDAYPSTPRLDIYILDLIGRTEGILGYCATDDPNVDDPGYKGLDASAYCVFDDDYAEDGADALQLLRATAAHEFFHAVQFAYNAAADHWLLEATATWMEDEVFDDANDNYRYLWTSQVVYPGIPLDLSSWGDALGGFKYGAYTFFQLLSESEGPAIVREVIKGGDGVPGKPGNHSLIALSAALAASGVDLAGFVNAYAVANWWPPAFYEEGASWIGTDSKGRATQLSVPSPKPFIFTGERRASPQRTKKLDHLTSGYATFVPGSWLAARTKLAITVDLSAAGPGARATVVSWSRSNVLKATPISLTGSGIGTATIDGFKRLKHVVLVLSNASTRVRDCGTDLQLPITACLGVPVDDRMPFRYRAELRG